MRDVTPNLNVCPSCAAPFEHFLRWFVRRWTWRWSTAPWAVICRACKDVVGWEHLP